MRVLLIVLFLLASCELQELDIGKDCNIQGHYMCSGVCTNIMNNDNCGECGKRCGNGENCQLKEGGFRCVVTEKTCEAENQKYCNGECVDIGTDSHCGGCEPCKSYQKCVSGSNNTFVCERDCFFPKMVCGDRCVDPSKKNCGSCGNECSQQEVCRLDDFTATCVKECNAPNIETDDGQCILPNTYQHCGKKNAYCSPETHECLKTSAEGDTPVFECRDKCTNGRKDIGETAVDCGGICLPCLSCSAQYETLDCGEDSFCDSAVGYLCSKRCKPDSGQANTVSRDCVGADQICRADGRCASKYFTTVWRLSAPEDLSIELLYDGKSACDFDVDWGDGKTEHINECTKENLTHGYAKVGTYQVRISGIYDGWGGTETEIKSSKYDIRNRKKLKDVLSFGPAGLKPGAFAMCHSLRQLPQKEIPDATLLKNLQAMFYSNFSFNRPIGHWDTRNVTDMSLMFWGASSFNRSIGEWDTRNVTNMLLMFAHAHSFNQPIGEWNVGSVTNMVDMFREAAAFNRSIEKWNVGKVTDMSGMFADARSFDQDLSRWDVSNVTQARLIFGGSGLSKNNYCKLANNEHWRKWLNISGLNTIYDCS